MSRWFNRSTVTFVVNETAGVLIIVHELMSDGERPFFLALAGALMGLPFVLAADGWKMRKEEDKKEDDRWSHLP